MSAGPARITSVDDYIASLPPLVQKRAWQLRRLIKQTAPEAQEKLSYGIPYYDFHGRLIYWGAWKDHISLYLMATSREALESEIEQYRTSKATLHFPLAKPLPKELIIKIVTVQAAANLRGA